MLFKYVGVALLALAGLVALFGRDRAWEALGAAWQYLIGSGAPGVM